MNIEISSWTKGNSKEYGLNKIKSIYLAAPWVCKDKAAEVREQLQNNGFIVTSRWIDVPDEAERNEEYKKIMSVKDYADVVRADAIVVLNLEKSEGKAVETGIALAMNKPVIIIGEKTNIFHWLPQIILTNTVEEAIIFLGNIGT